MARREGIEPRSSEITLAVPLISGRATGTTLFDRFVRLSLAARENRSRCDAILSPLARRFAGAL